MSLRNILLILGLTFCSVGAATFPTHSTTTLTVDKTTGEIKGPVSAATFKTANGITGGGGGGNYIFTASDFNESGTTVSLDYVNGHIADGETNGFLSGGDWVDFKSKVPSTRTVNGHALSSNVTVTAADINATGSPTYRFITDSQLAQLALQTGTNTGDQQAFANIIVGATTIAAGGTAGNLTLVAGSGVTITPSGTGNRTITITATGGGGTVTITGTATANAVMVGNGGSDLKPSVATLDPITGNFTTPGAISAGSIDATTMNVGTLILGTSIPIAKGGTNATSAAGAWVNLTVPAVTAGGTAIDWAGGPSHSRTLAANTTYTFSNALDGQTIIVAVTNTASNYTVTWPTVQWAGGAAPTQTVGAKTDVYTFTKVGSTIYGAASQNHYAP